ncbi:MAG: amino acid ABC transporter ATP-binding protein [Synergistaceae bacterium]|nr:amino acid ABC transporter ATP-binding protein [Synergistaceae bacterium]
MIRLEHVRKVYPNAEPLKDVNAEINTGDVISVIGPSGTGKSTLLRCINLLERPDGGKIFFEDEEITSPRCNVHKMRQKMGMVFQQFNLFGNLTVIENIMLAPVRLKGESRQSAYDNGMKLLTMVGLPDKYLNYPDQLSGGQKQRIAIARTLAMNPNVILLDEPTSALDPTMVGEVQAVIRELARSGKTMVIVTHEMSFARAICNRIFFLDEGGIYEEGTPEQIFTAPKRERTRRFIRKLKVLEFTVKEKKFDFPGTVSGIDTFCRKNMISGKFSNRLQLVFEELLQQILLPSPEVRNIHAVIEYAEENGEISFDVKYDGKAMNPEESDNKLSYSILKAQASEIRYSYEESDGYTNRVRMLITDTPSKKLPPLL